MSIEITYFQKPCPHCKWPLIRVQKMHIAWSECRNKDCSYVINQSEVRPLPTRFPDLVAEPVPYAECYNRR